MRLSIKSFFSFLSNFFFFFFKPGDFPSGFGSVVDYRAKFTLSGVKVRAKQLYVRSEDSSCIVFGFNRVPGDD